MAWYYQNGINALHVGLGFRVGRRWAGAGWGVGVGLVGAVLGLGGYVEELMELLRDLGRLESDALVEAGHQALADEVLQDVLQHVGVGRRAGRERGHRGEVDCTNCTGKFTKNTRLDLTQKKIPFCIIIIINNLTDLLSPNYMP